MANSMFSSNVTGTNNALSNFISQSLGASNQNSLSGLTSVLSDYSSIKSGSYGKLLKAYYAKDTNKVSAATKTNQTEKNDKAGNNEKNSVKDVLQSTVSTAKKADKASAEAATKLVDATTALDKLSYKEDNRDKIAEAISSFVKEYNDTLQAASKSDLVNVVQNAEWMAGGSKSNKKLLASVGVTINEDNTLSFDKDIFAKASLTTAKSVFDGNTSFAHQVANRASKIYAEAASAGTATATYSQKADYTNVTTGNMLDSLM